MERKRGVLAAMALAMLLAPALPVPADGGGDYPPPASGDWVITQDTWVENETLYLVGDLNVTGAKLTLRNTTLVIYDPRTTIRVEAGAAIDARGCEFKVGLFIVDGSALFDNSSFWPGQGNGGWLALNTSDASFTNCVLEGTIECFSVPGPSFKNTTVQNSSIGAIFRGATTYGGLKFLNCGEGASGGPDAVISNCTFERCRLGALVQDRTEIESSDFIDCTWGVSELDPDELPIENVIRNCSFTGCDLGYRAGLGSTVVDCKFIGCIKGLEVPREATVKGCEFLACDMCIMGTWVDDLQISDSIFKGNWQAVNITTSKDSSISGCYFEPPEGAVSDSPPILDLYGYFGLQDSVLSSGNVAPIYIRAGGVTATNVTVLADRIGINGGAWLKVAWYLETTVLYKNGTPVEGASVRVADRTGKTLASPLTGMVGRTPRLWVVEYFREWNRTEYYTPLSLNASKDGLARNLSVNLNQNLDLTLTLADVTAPAVVFNSPANGTLLNRTRVRFTGTASDDQGVASVRLRAGSGEWVPAGGTTEWNATLDLAEGDNLIVAEASDAEGNTALAFLSVRVDSLPPVVEITYPAQGLLVNTTSVELSGRTEPGCTVLVDGEAAPFYLGQFSATVALQEGPNTIVVTARDAAGNVGAASVNITRDTIAPSLTLTAPRNGEITGRAIVNVSGTAEATAALFVNEALLPRSGAFFAVEVMLSEGVNNVSERAVDAAGNQATILARVILDRTPPAITLELKNGTIYQVALLTVAGRTEPGAALSVNGVPVAVAADGNFSTKVSLRPGPNQIRVEATDPFGNPASLDRTVTYEQPARPKPPVVGEPEPTIDPAIPVAIGIIIGFVLMAALLFRGKPPIPAGEDSKSGSLPAGREP